MLSTEKCCGWRSSALLLKLQKALKVCATTLKPRTPSGAGVKLDAGQEHDFKIIKMNAEEKKVGLSLRAVGEEASRADVEAYKHPASSASGYHDSGRHHQLEACRQRSGIARQFLKAQ